MDIMAYSMICLHIAIEYSNAKKALDKMKYENPDRSLLLRCASISCFQVVSQSVIDIFPIPSKSSNTSDTIDNQSNEDIKITR